MVTTDERQDVGTIGCCLIGVSWASMMLAGGRKPMLGILLRGLGDDACGPDELEVFVWHLLP